MFRFVHVAAVLLAANSFWAASSPPLAAAEPAATVHLVVDYGDGVEKHFTQLPHAAGMTVLDAMNKAADHARGIRFKHRGQGSTAFLTQIDDLKNEGRGRNWLFEVNGKLAQTSFAVQKLEAGDRVRWAFRKYE